MTSQSNRPLARFALAGVLLCLQACAPAVPFRVPLPSPFPLTYGGTTVPGNGVILGWELADALRGQEMGRAETVGLILGAGVANRVTVSTAIFQGHQDSDPEGGIWRVGVRIGPLVGPKSSTKVQLARATVARSDGSAQADRLRTIDVAIPTEWLVGGSDARHRASLYAGPRFTHERYLDDLNPAESLRHLYVGALGGFHLQYRAVHFFGEATLLRVPRTTFHGVAYGGRFTVMPALGVTVLIGKAQPRPADARRPPPRR